MPPSKRKISLKGDLIAHFILDEDTSMVKCMHCDTQLAYYGSTSSLKYHLSRRYVINNHFNKHFVFVMFVLRCIVD